MALKKSQLYSTLWKSCDELRGGMDASQYKDYVLVLLFVKYVSDKAASQKHYDLVVPKGGSFADIAALKGKEKIGEEMNKIIGKLADENELKGVIDVADWNDPDKLGKGKDMVDRLSKLVALFENPALDFRSNRADGDDLLGDAYEFLMRHFATESGKSKGQFYTPAEVSRIMAKVIGVGGAKDPKQTIHDPTCGSGSLLIKAHDEAKSATGLDLAIYGQEMDNATKALARMNFILHDCSTGEVWQDNTLSEPHFTDPKTGALKTFDFVVANPPFSHKAWTTGFDPANDRYGRFAFGIPPQKNGDYAFLLHILACLKSTGKGAVILPHGVLFRGGSEATIRREVVKRGYIKGIIGLPANLFYGTGIPACILVLAKEGAADRKSIFMIDASKGFIKDGNKNRLRAQDIHKIVDVFTRQIELPGYSKRVSLAEISGPKNDFNLNLPRYIDSSEPEDIQDIEGHLHGGIPDRDLEALERYWKVFPAVREALFKKASRLGYAELKVAAADIKTTIFGHAEFRGWSDQTQKLFAKWRAESAPRLRAIAKGDKPKFLIGTLSEELLAVFQKAKLLDPYDIYQHLMDYWAETMQDDVYLVAADGWKQGVLPREILQVKDENGKLVWPEEHDFKLGKRRFKSDLVSAQLLVARYFVTERDTIEHIKAEVAATEQQLDERREEQSGEEGLLAEVTEGEGDKLKITAKAIKSRLKEIGKAPDFADERKALEDYAALLDKQSDARGRLKQAQEQLDEKIAAKYGEIKEEEIKTLAVDDKWLSTLHAAVEGEIDRASQMLTNRIRQLAERYAIPLPQLIVKVETLSARVDEHLRKQLLTGQTRLPGFSGKWETKRVDEMGEVLAGKALDVHGPGTLRPYLRTKNVLDGRIDLDDVLEMPMTDAEFERFRVMKNDVLLNEGQSLELVGRCSMYRDELSSPCAMQNQLLRFRARKYTSPAFAEHLFRYCQHTGVFSAIATQTTSVAHLGSTRFSGLQLLWPSDPAEQEAIATILSDMDAEMAGLEQRLEKMRLLKQGMMQEFLTGRTRII